MCTMFTLKQCRNNLYKMEQLLPTDMDKAYPEQLINMLSMGVALAVTKLEEGKRGRLSRTIQSAFPGLWGLNMGIMPRESRLVLEEEDKNDETVA